MSTRALIVIEDGSEHGTNRVQIYRHSNGYPKHGKHGVVSDLALIEPAGLCWPFPRFEADEFAAAVVCAMKKQAGGIRIDGNPKAWEMMHGDIEWVYVVSASKSSYPSKTTKPVLKVYHVANATEIGMTPSAKNLVFEGHVGDEYPEDSAVQS